MLPAPSRRAEPTFLGSAHPYCTVSLRAPGHADCIIDFGFTVSCRFITYSRAVSSSTCVWLLADRKQTASKLEQYDMC